MRWQLIGGLILNTGRGAAALPSLPGAGRPADAAERAHHPARAPIPGWWSSTNPSDIDGRGEVTIDAGGRAASVLDNRRRHGAQPASDQPGKLAGNDIDAGIQVRGNFNVIKDNEIGMTSFGIDLQQSANNIVRRNHIPPKVDLVSVVTRSVSGTASTTGSGKTAPSIHAISSSGIRATTSYVATKVFTR